MANARVLLVDSDPAALGLLTYSMQRFGLQIAAANDVDEAVDALRFDRPDVVVSEVDSGTGLALLERLRRDPLTRDVPMVLTAKGPWARRRQQARELGAQELITKPAFAQDIAVLTWLYAGKSAGEEWFEGRFGKPSLPVLLRGLLAGGRSGTLRLEPSGAVVRFRDGAVIDATLDQLGGERALLRILTLETGSYDLTFGPLTIHPSLQFELADLTGRGSAHVRQWGELLAKLGSLDQVLEVDFEALSEQLPDLPHGLWGLLRLFDGKRTLGAVLADGPLDELTSGRAIAKLLAMHLFERQPSPRWDTQTPGLPDRSAHGGLTSNGAADPYAGGEVAPRPNTQAAVATTSLQLPASAGGIAAAAAWGSSPAEPLPELAFGEPETPLRLAADVAIADALERAFFDAPVDAIAEEAVEHPRERRVASARPVSLLGAFAVVVGLAAALALLWRGTPGAPGGSPTGDSNSEQAAAAIAAVRPPAAAPENAPAPADALPLARQGPAEADPEAAGPAADPAPGSGPSAAPSVAAEGGEPSAAPPPGAAPSDPLPTGAPEGSGSVAELLDKGQLAYDRQQFKQAVAAFSAAAALAPESPVAALGLGAALYDSGKLTAANAALERAAALDPQNGRAAMLLGAIAQERQQGQAARGYYQRALDLDPQGEHAEELKSLMATLGN